MARPIFSALFIAERGVSSSSPTIVVPDNHTYIVKQLTWYSNPFVQPCRGFFRDLVSGATLFSCGTQAGTPGWFGFYGALVFAERSSFRWEVDAGIGDAADVYAGGYDLINPPPPA